MSRHQGSSSEIRGNRKRPRQGSNNDDNSTNGTFSLHIATENSDSVPSSKKKPKLSRKQRLKKARDKLNEIDEFSKLPENDKRNIYKDVLTDKERYEKELESERQNYITELKREKEKCENKIEEERKKFQKELEAEKEKYQSELETCKEKFKKELNSQRQNFQREKENLMRVLNSEKAKIIKLEMQLYKKTEDKSIQTEKKMYSTSSAQTENEKPSTKNFVDLTSRTSILKRLNQADFELKKISTPTIKEGNDENENGETKKNMTEMLKILCKKYGMTTGRISRLNPSTTAFIFKHCRINVRKGRLLRKLLKDDNPFSSEREVNNMYAEFDKEIKIVETEIIVDNKIVIVSEVTNIREVMQSRIQRKADNGNLLENPLNKKKLSFAFFGDDGGGSFKGGISPAECENPNSPDNFTPLVVLTGKSSTEIIYAACERVAEQLEKIETITVTINGEEHVFEIEWSLGGDYMFNLQACGRKACGTNCYCIWCRFKRKTKLFKQKSSTEKGAKRETFDPLPDDDGYNGPPLFKKILPFFILIPMLHIFLGIGLLLINSIEEILKQLDFNTLTAEEKKKYGQKMMEKDKQIKEAQNLLEDLEKQIEEKRVLMETLQDITDLKLTKDEMNEKISGCCAKLCCEKLGYEAGEIKFCTCCTKHPKGYHHLCLGTLRSKKDIKCADVVKYEKSGGLLSNISKVVNQLQKEIDGLVVKKLKAEMKLDGLLIKKFDELGPHMKEYNEILMELNVSKQAWYQTFTGNHMRILLKKANIFERLSAIKISDKLKHLVEALCLLKKIQDYTEARYLSEEEIATLKVDVENLKNHMVKYLGDFNVTPKFHILIHHVVEIAEIRKTIGLFTEQQIEHVHALFNTELKRAKFLRKHKRNSWLMKEMYRRNAMKDAFGDLMEDNL